MINADMRIYDYFTLGENNAYGQPSMSAEPVGTIKMAINISSQSVQDNINYKDCQYVGLTHAEVNDTYVIQYGNEKLKVLYVNPKGRYKQVFMREM
jgi:hypothetical protein